MQSFDPKESRGIPPSGGRANSLHELHWDTCRHRGGICPRGTSRCARLLGVSRSNDRALLSVDDELPHFHNTLLFRNVKEGLLHAHHQERNPWHVFDGVTDVTEGCRFHAVCSQTPVPLKPFQAPSLFF